MDVTWRKEENPLPIACTDELLEDDRNDDVAKDVASGSTTSVSTAQLHPTTTRPWTSTTQPSAMKTAPTDRLQPTIQEEDAIFCQILAESALFNSNNLQQLVARIVPRVSSIHQEEVRRLVKMHLVSIKLIAIQLFNNLKRYETNDGSGTLMSTMLMQELQALIDRFIE